jgi:hypothetical protein
MVMKAKIFAEFKTLRPGDKRNSVVEVGEVVEGPVAEAAIANNFGKQVPEDTPVGKGAAAPTPAKAPAKGGKGKGAKAGDSGDGDQGTGEGE